ncbi:MAG: helix-turn-helix transcriptional regulator [Gemmatimonadetes bacterium]|nr:helix-turn-helix transcriptional regulator [Gemmatimonadota bacterium]
MMKFRLRELLEREGAPTQSELARRIGMPRQQVNRLVNDGIKRIDLDTLDRIYRALGCESVDELILHLPPAADPPDSGEASASQPSPAKATGPRGA